MHASVRRMRAGPTRRERTHSWPVTVANNGPSLAAPSVKDALRVLRATGLRASTARRLVLEALFAAGEPVSAEDIAQGLDGRLPRSDLGSVYRNLEVLERLGLVRHLHRAHGAALYALAREGQEYLVCDSCGSVAAVEAAELEPVRALLRERFGFDPSFIHFPMVGVCGGCRREGAA
jgi:Fur family transcriptional regulator, ferric uptake regulator